MRGAHQDERADILQIQEGMRYGYNICCIAQFVNDGKNLETFLRALMRRGDTSVEGYIPCYDCQEDLPKKRLLTRKNGYERDGAEMWKIMMRQGDIDSCGHCTVPVGIATRDRFAWMDEPGMDMLIGCGIGSLIFLGLVAPWLGAPLAVGVVALMLFYCARGKTPGVRTTS